MVRNLSGLEYKHWTCVLIADRHGLGSVLQDIFPKKSNSHTYLIRGKTFRCMKQFKAKRKG